MIRIAAHSVSAPVIDDGRKAQGSHHGFSTQAEVSMWVFTAESESLATSLARSRRSAPSLRGENGFWHTQGKRTQSRKLHCGETFTDVRKQEEEEEGAGPGRRETCSTEYGRPGKILQTPERRSRDECVQRCLVQKSKKGKDSPVGLPAMSCRETESPAVGVQN